MHDLLIGLVFLAMFLAPALIAMREDESGGKAKSR